MKHEANKRHARLGIAVGVIGLALLGCEVEDDNSNPGGPDAGQVESSTFTSIYARMGDMCAECHSPDGPGRTPLVEKTMDWTSQATAYSSLQGTASGLMGNQEGCNGVSLIGSNSGESLIVAALDEDVRGLFDVTGFPGCNVDTISDMTLKIGGPLDLALLADLKEWIDEGAPNN